MDDLSELLLLLTPLSERIVRSQWLRQLELLRVAIIIMFQNARNTVINGGVFTMGGDLHSHHVVNDGKRCEATYYPLGRKNTDGKS